MVGQAMLFLHFSDDRVESFKSEMNEAARQFSGNNISFLIGDVSAADRAFQVFYSYQLSSLLVKYSRTNPLISIHAKPFSFLGSRKVIFPSSSW
jgi:hypothetical protein